MFYKLSNTADRIDIENEFHLGFEFPNIYNPSAVINGLKESSLAIITNQEPNKIQYGIWGLLPESYEDSWDAFQEITNTLNVNLENLKDNDQLYSDALQNRRCLIIVTGFFTSSIYNGFMRPYHVYIDGYRPFYIAGVYNKLGDGFITCSLLITKSTNSFKDIPSFIAQTPLIFHNQDAENWLNSTFTIEEISNLIDNHNVSNIRSHPLSKEYYKDLNIYNEIINSGEFKNLLI